MTTLTLARSDEPSEILALIGTAQPLLRNLTGVDVTIIVRSSDGVVAHDGILELNNGNYSLRLHDGTRRTITVLPAALREHVGSRIYIVGPVDRPSTWGIVRAR